MLSLLICALLVEFRLEVSSLLGNGEPSFYCSEMELQAKSSCRGVEFVQLQLPEAFLFFFLGWVEKGKWGGVALCFLR